MTLRLRADDLEWREIDDEIVVLDSREAAYLSVQGSGALVWRLLARSTSRDALTEALVNAYGIDHVRAADDVDAFLGSLAHRGLLAA